MKKIELEKELEDKKREFGIRFILSFSVISLVNIILLYITDYYQMKIFVIDVNFLYIMLVISLYTAYILSKSKYNFSAIFSGFFAICFIIATYLSLLLCKISETVFVFYIPLIALFFLLSTLKRAIYFTIFVLVLCYFMPDLSSALQLNNYEKQFVNNPQGLKFQEYLSIIFSAHYTFLIIYYYLKIDEIKKRYIYSSIVRSTNNQSQNESIRIDFTDPAKGKYRESVESYHDNEKYRTLYDRIISFFDYDNPYQNPEFNIRKLAESVDSNSTYVSKSLNMIGNKKFSELVNEYRIKQVLQELEKDSHQKFTIEHIYTNAGFSQQATFNRIFKEYTGSTPSEYIKNLQKQS
ncbi:hypothetical protein ASG31_00815 [Chryseobacterium sp. Leaf404]|uniref:helix-turn-helix domain-containing protein n=1 Tax=unclassified Chryseobacterium TaxID=2593645 RepID=UPI0006FFF596|nr:MULTISPECIES: helix-turn-helix domain-containing protein [unclassified Chryseobacterium]KQT21918.1 hypothetical protein ASG31_00815 [Chryseobacterium sp. Leaf404]